MSHLDDTDSFHGITSNGTDSVALEAAQDSRGPSKYARMRKNETLQRNASRRLDVIGSENDKVMNEDL